MDLSSLIDDTPLHSTQILGTADALLTDATDTILHAQDPVLATTHAGGGDATGLLDGLLAGATQDAGANPTLLGPVGGIVPGIQALSAQPIEQLANNAVLDLHYTLEQLAHDLALADGLHGLINFGETIGLGKIGGANLVTDVLDTPSAAVGGNLAPVTHIPTDLGNIGDAAQLLVSDLGLDAAHINDVLTNPVGHIESAIPTLEAFPATALANEAIDTVHGILETVLDPIIPNTTHGIIGTGNALGLGELGGQNLLTDVLHTPTALLSGDTSPLTHLPADLAQIGTAVGGLLDGIGADLSGSSLLGGLTHPASGGGILGGSLPGLGIVGTATGLVDGAVNGLGDATGLGGITHAVTGALGAITGGSSSPLTGLLEVPGAILGGASNGAGSLPGDGGASLGALGSVVGAVASEVGHLGDGASLLAPVTGLLSGDAGGVLGGNAGGILGTVTGALGGGASPLSPVTGLLSGDAGGVLGGNAGGVLGTVTGALGGGASPLAPVTGLLSGDAGGVLGGNAGGVLGTVTGALGGGSSLLAPVTGLLSGDAGGVLGGNAGGVLGTVTGALGGAGATVPTVGAIAALLPDSIHLPTATTGGSDALSGVLQAVTGSGASASGGASANAGLDLGIVHIDAPIAAAHADPLGALGHVLHLG